MGGGRYERDFGEARRVALGKRVGLALLWKTKTKLIAMVSASAVPGANFLIGLVRLVPVPSTLQHSVGADMLLLGNHISFHSEHSQR